jgi:hypothetical protein
MSKRINVTLPDATMAVLDRVAPKGHRSRLISQAVLHYVKTRGTENLKQRLKEGPWPMPSWIWKLPRSGFRWSMKYGSDSNKQNQPQRLSAAGGN